MRQVIAFTAFNRLGYLSETLASWQQVRGFEQAAVHAHIDPSDVAGLAASEFLAQKRSRTGPEVTVRVNPERLGEQRNPFGLLDCVFASRALTRGEPGDFVILAEDDFTVGEDTLEYFAFARRAYRDQTRVLAVSATQFEAQGSAEEVLLLAGWTGWVWGTWRDRWEAVIRPGWRFGYEDGGWDWHLVRTCQRFGLCTAVPALSRSQHIGQYGGMHTQPGAFADHQSRCYAPQLPPQAYRRRQPEEPLALRCHHDGT